MAFLIHPQWVSSTSYTAGTTVNFNGVDYEAINAVTSTTNPSQDGTNWEAVAVTNIQDYNSLVEAVRLQLNVRPNDSINNSIPMFIQLTEESFKTRIRSPQHRVTRTFTTERLDDGQARIEAPADLLQVIGMRATSATGEFTSTNNYNPYNNDTVEILNANREEYLRVLRGQSDQSGSRDYNSFESAVYWFDNRYFYLAPAYRMGQVIELVYYRQIPQLGTLVNLTNEDGDPINSDGMTSAQWIAAGNAAGDFVQATDTVTTNWYTAAAPQMLLYGACLRAKPFLRNDDDRIQMWGELYEQAELEIRDMIDRFEEDQPHTLFIQNTYSQNI